MIYVKSSKRTLKPSKTNSPLGKHPDNSKSYKLILRPQVHIRYQILLYGIMGSEVAVQRGPLGTLHFGTGYRIPLREHIRFHQQTSYLVRGNARKNSLLPLLVLQLTLSRHGHRRHPNEHPENLSHHQG